MADGEKNIFKVFAMAKNKVYVLFVFLIMSCSLNMHAKITRWHFVQSIPLAGDIIASNNDLL